jgi:O-succinylbenzoic acid--CoA ligase
VRFLHGYGSTETYGVAAIGEVDPEREAMEANPSCGYPIPGLDFALLRQGTAAGELLLRGVGVAAGYVTRDGLTPLVPGPDAWFGTGDVFDHTSDGPLRFVGRMDRLCKVHGVRVSLEHVERVLESASGGAAAAYYDPKRDALVAVVERGDFGELRAAVRRRVGSASVPKFLVRVGSMPRTASGKIDYAAVNRADSVARLTSHRGGANT